MNFKYNGNIIDIEASSLAVESYPIEVALINHRGETFNSLIKPHQDWKDWNMSSQCIHGISQEQLQDEGASVHLVCEAISDLAAGESYFSDYWVCDDRWLNLLFTSAKIERQLRCLPFEYFMPDTQLRDWQALKNASAAKLGLAQHRALNDVHIIQQALDDLADKGAIQQPLRKISKQIVLDNWNDAFDPIYQDMQVANADTVQPAALRTVLSK